MACRPPQRPREVTGCGPSASTTDGLEGIVLDYRMHYGAPGSAELAYFATLPTLAQTVREASLARSAGGKRLPHQRRIPRPVLEECARRLERALHAIEAAPDFETLHQIVRHNLVGIHGVGELTIYDTALRIGFRLNLQPARVFLHAGTRIGARRLGVIDEEVVH